MSKETLSAKKSEQYLSFLLGNEVYGLNILRIQEIRGWEKTTRLPGVPDYVKGVINIRGSVVPVIDLRQRFNIGEPTYDESTVVIITRFGAIKSKQNPKIVGLVVDGVSDVEDVEMENLQFAPSFNQGARVSDEFIRGLASLQNRMMIVLNVEKLLEQGVFEVVKKEGQGGEKCLH
ncbi:MAG: chemotaxis protein CheW [Thiomicrospira sp.]